ncbi:MAG: hypothetical protein AB7G23_08575 [Vicinamibacterales bacterium]
MVSYKTVTGVLAATVLGACLGLSGEASSVTSSRTTHLTFNAAVVLPGVTLPAGSYTFELAAPDTNLDIVRVMNRERTRIYFMGFTAQTPRPRDMPQGQHVMFGEFRRGTPAPIRVWFPPGASVGHEFIYR